jgi:hypothetical protein
MYNWKQCAAKLAVAAFVACASASVFGDIVSVGGAAVVDEPPANISAGQWQSSQEIRVWFEREAVLASNLNLNHVNTGLVNGTTTLVSGAVDAGTVVQSYMARLDPRQNNGITRTGSITFNSDILGVIVTSGFAATDSILGRGGIIYNTNVNRGLELGENSNESFAISTDRRTLEFTMYVLNQPTDDIRIITADSIAEAGACCLATRCTTLAASGCSTAGGSFLGVGIACGSADNRTTCCPANFNLTGGVTVQDIFDFLSAWFAGSAGADFNSVGGITVQDVFDFLQAWFLGC